MSAQASQAFSIAHCTDSEDLPYWIYPGSLFGRHWTVCFSVWFKLSQALFEQSWNVH